MNIKNEVEYWLQECLDNDQHLNDWERNFLDSIEQRVANEHTLSKKQYDKLKDIYERVTS